MREFADCSRARFKRLGVCRRHNFFFALIPPSVLHLGQFNRSFFSSKLPKSSSSSDFTPVGFVSSSNKNAAISRTSSVSKRPSKVLQVSFEVYVNYIPIQTFDFRLTFLRPCIPLSLRASPFHVPSGGLRKYRPGVSAAQKRVRDCLTTPLPRPVKSRYNARHPLCHTLSQASRDDYLTRRNLKANVILMLMP